ncbi:hypothetical protein GN156_07485 [bacterium LRH843]|nr:hypothetical protein [bacterium LRH843]
MKIEKKHFLLILICSIPILNAALLYYDKEISGISKEAAETIALEQAEIDGFLSPVLWSRFGEESWQTYQFSVEHNKDVMTWRVNIDTENNPRIKNTPAAIYFISRDNGDIIHVINGLQ